MNKLARPYDELIATTVKSVEIRSETTYSWFKRSSPRLPQKLGATLPAESKRAYLLLSLRQELYKNMYCPGFPMDNDPGPNRRLHSDNAFIESLAGSNRGRGYWSTGWTLEKTFPSSYVLTRDGLTVLCPHEICRFDENSGSAVGSDAWIRFPKEFRELSPGYYVACSDAEYRDIARASTVRVYWNLLPEGASILLRSVTDAYNEAHLPFSIKTLNDTHAYSRCDAAVLYISKQTWLQSRNLFESVIESVHTFLKPGTPAFTKRMAAGVGIAEDPLDGLSFGMHRCGLVAEAIVLAHERGLVDTQQRIEMVEEVFESNGVDPQNPYINIGSSDIYVPLIETDRPTLFTENRANLSVGSIIEESPLSQARIIAEDICDNAIYYAGQCNWVGPILNFGSDTDRVRQYGALSGDVYGGTAGIAWFLGELSAVIEEPIFRRAALAAMRFAKSTMQCRHDVGDSFYSGRTGVAYVAARLAKVLNEEEFAEIANDITEDMRVNPSESLNVDLLSGSSGTIIGLLALASMVSKPDLRDITQRLGQGVLDAAERTENGLSWTSPNIRSIHNLTGYSHGTSGIAQALMELYFELGEKQFCDGAQLAFAYEDSAFDSARGNWYDFRLPDGLAPRTRWAGKSASFWCHGSAGIAVARLRAFGLSGNAVYRSDARVALAATMADSAAHIRGGFRDPSLCHGIAGNAEILAEGARILGESFSDIDGEAILAEHLNMWVSGPKSEPSDPGLMLGQAGVGQHYLRLSNPKLPSAVILNPTMLQGVE